MENKVTVTVKEGRVRGIKTKSMFSAKEYYSFFGIPYGQSTAGSARFRDPVKVKPWKNVLDATTEKEGCCQYSVSLDRNAGSEDCLYNNIHTPHIPGPHDPLKPVIVLIHPGGHFHGSVETGYYGSADYIMHRDIVYVGITHRLHILGYLNLGLEECSGNQALKDIILSLQWIKENINAFGGDPNNVTLLGSSSGSTIVHCLLLSPKAEGLFHKAIMMGMYIFNPTLFMKKNHKEEAYEVAEMLGYQRTTKNDEKMLISFYKRLSLDTFIKLRTESKINRGIQLFPSAPFIMTLDDGEAAIFTKNLEELIPNTRRIPLMFGICEREAAMAFTRISEKSTREYFYKSYLQNENGWGREITEDQVEQIKKQIDDYYFKGGSYDTATLSQKVDLQTDIAFSDVYRTLLDIISSNLPSSVYVYKFQFEGEVLTLKKTVQKLLDEVLEGTFHADDFGYWAYQSSFFWLKAPTSLNSQTREMIEKFTKLISTFARTGNPNYEGLEVEWKPTSPEKPCYLNINNPLEMVDGKLNNDRMIFWENIVKKYKKT